MQNSHLIASSYIADASIKSSENYSTLLERFGAKYHKSDYYWEVGRPEKTQGWVLHISVVAIELPELLKTVLPFLLEKEIPFKIPMDKATARTMLDGNLGIDQIGKVVSIYPASDDTANKIAKELIKLTADFRGPAVHTDARLGANVYTRYEIYSPQTRVGTNGMTEKYMKMPDGQEILDTLTMPFELPNIVNWPFANIASPVAAKKSKNLKNIYRPISVIKPDARGDVIKAIYLKKIFLVDNCIIKSGRKNMIVDDCGRDICHRLKWQKTLQQKLHSVIPLPKIIDLFEENEDTYLVMEEIKGQSLNDALIEIHNNQRCWGQLSSLERTLILNWILKIIDLISQFHQLGFVHRDIAPGNFMIDKKGHIILIDIELAYDLKNSQGNLPLELGTPGFMSPEQEAVETPTIAQDIYGLGALMICAFTCLMPTKIDANNPNQLFESLNYFTGHKKIAQLICSCLSRNPDGRPNLLDIKTNLLYLKNELINYQWRSSTQVLNNGDLDTLIKATLDTLGKHPPMPISEQIYMSKTKKEGQEYITVQKEYSPYPGIHTGMTGVLYLLAKAQKAAYPIGSNKTPYLESWNFVYQKYLKDLTNINPGLYHGAAGIALALAKGVDAGLITDEEKVRAQIHNCFQLPVEKFNLADGLAGQGLALLQCEAYLPANDYDFKLETIVTKLLAYQLKELPVGLGHGLCGIIIFLLEYTKTNKNSIVQDSIDISLNYLLDRTRQGKELFNPRTYKKLLNKHAEYGDERTGIILCFIKAYEIYQQPIFKEAAECALSVYPDFVVNNNFSQEGGMTALGEIYLEAWRIFRKEEWKNRANQILSALNYTVHRDKQNNCYWRMDDTNKPAADLFIGNSGVIHFLLRCNNPDKETFILL